MTGLGGVSPIDGVRVSLDLVEFTETRAVYTAGIRWTNPESGNAMDVTGRATVATEPLAVTFHGLTEAPEAAVEFTQALLRTIARSVRDARWPRRITRWRDEAPTSRHT